jgi:hypothetical protein
MARLTRSSVKDRLYFVDDDQITHHAEGYSGHAIHKLAKFENIYEDMEANQIKISIELENLRSQGQTHSVKFKELMIKKLTNVNILILFRANGLQ